MILTCEYTYVPTLTQRVEGGLNAYNKRDKVYVNAMMGFTSHNFREIVL